MGITARFLLVLQGDVISTILVNSYSYLYLLRNPLNNYSMVQFHWFYIILNWISFGGDPFFGILCSWSVRLLPSGVVRRTIHERIFQVKARSDSGYISDVSQRSR